MGGDDLDGELGDADRRLWEPPPEAVDDLAAAPGDVLLLGAGGKLGLSLARMTRLAVDAAGGTRRVIAVSRFSEPGRRGELAAAGVETVVADAADPAALATLPDAANVIYLVGRKFGTSGDEPTTWATNTYLPARVAERFAGSRLVAFSTGNVYPLTPVGSGGADEHTPPGPVGEYAQSCLGRERLLQHLSVIQGTPVGILRLNYAIDLRYGVLHDVARAVLAGEPVDVTTGSVNVIWQGDVNAITLRSLRRAASPADVLNVTGPETVSVRWLAQECGRRLGRDPVIAGGGPDGAAEQRRAVHGAVRLPAGVPGRDARLDLPVGRGRGPEPRQAHAVRATGRGVLMDPERERLLRRGTVIPAHPLALDATRRLDEDRQRALTRYYLDAGAGGIAVAVHTTQFAIHEPSTGLYEPVLALAAQESAGREPVLRVAGVLGPTARAVREAEIAAGLGYDLALVAASSWPDADEQEILDGLAAVGEVLPVFGFYLQPAVGGRPFGYGFWRRLAELPALRAIKIAPFDRFGTLDVVRAVTDSGRAGEIALYTGNDDAIVVDLLTRYPGGTRMVGALLGQFAVWTGAAVVLHARIRELVGAGAAIPPAVLAVAADLTDANAAIFDAAGRFRGCIPGIHEVLVREGILGGRWCLDPAEDLSPGQDAEIDRVWRAYPYLRDPEELATLLRARGRGGRGGGGGRRPGGHGTPGRDGERESVVLES